MDFEAGLPQFGSVTGEKRNHCVLTAILRSFSKFDKNVESEFTEYKADEEEFEMFFRPVFYANGDCKDNEGYVSTIFYGCGMLPFVIYFSDVDFSCTVAVVDVAGNKRFMQTLAYVHDPRTPRGLDDGVPKFGMGRYLKRETLLNDPAELLPDDCLTICVEVDYVIRTHSLDFRQCIIQDTFQRDGDKHYFSLDSAFGEELRKVCDYFRSASDTPMIESKSRRVYVPDEELKAFHHMELLFTQAKELKVESMADICQLYVVADKYDIQTVIESCRDLVKTFFRTTDDPKVMEHAEVSIPEILELADKYRDRKLKDAVQTYLDIKQDLRENDYALAEHLKKALSTEWDCEFQEIEKSCFFKMSRIEDKEPELEFYQ